MENNKGSNSKKQCTINGVSNTFKAQIQAEIDEAKKNIKKH